MDLGMSELLVIGIVALVVIGPRDLPEMFRQLGRMTAKLRSMAREFSRAMEQAAKETGVNDMAKDLQAVTNPRSLGLGAVKDAVDKFEKWDPIKNAAKPTSSLPKPTTLVPPPMPATPAQAPVIAPPAEAVGPNTAALYRKKAAREAILSESAAKLRALDAEPDVPAKPPSTRKPKAEKPASAKQVTRMKAAPKVETPALKPARKAPVRQQKAAEE